MTTDQTNWVFNLNDEAQGIARKLGEGITTRIFPGDQAMLSIVRIAPHSASTLHSHPQEQWGVLLEGALVLDIFAPPRDEYRKAGEGFGA